MWSHIPFYHNPSDTYRMANGVDNSLTSEPIDLKSNYLFWLRMLALNGPKSYQPTTNRMHTNLLNLAEPPGVSLSPISEEETADWKLDMSSPRQINGRIRIQSDVV